MTEAIPPATNVDRLKKNLKSGSLAARLVDAHQNGKPADRVEGIKAVLKATLEQVRATLDKA